MSIWTISKGVGADFSTVTAAHDSASVLNGDTLKFLDSSDYNESKTFTKNLTLMTEDGVSPRVYSGTTPLVLQASCTVKGTPTHKLRIEATLTNGIGVQLSSANKGLTLQDVAFTIPGGNSRAVDVSAAQSLAVAIARCTMTSAGAPTNFLRGPNATLATVNIEDCETICTLESSLGSFVVLEAWSGYIKRCIIRGPQIRAVYNAFHSHSGQVTIANNLFLANSPASSGVVGLFLSGNRSDTKVVCNTLIGPGSGVVDVRGVSFDSSAGGTFKDNIVYGWRTGLEAGAGISSDYNDFYGNNTNRSGGVAAGAHDITSDPLFVGGGDYRLGDGSPCINVGMNATETPDLAGVARPQGVAYDLGAYEKIVAPWVTSVNAVTSTSVQVNFDKEMDQVGAEFFEASNYVITGGPGGAVSAVDMGPDAYSAVLHFSETKNGTSYTLTVSNVKSSAGIVVDPDHDTGSFVGVGVSPNVSGATATGRTRCRVTFDEPVTGADLEDETKWAVTGQTVTSATAAVDRTYVDLVFTDAAAMVSLEATAPNTLTDDAENPISGTTAMFDTQDVPYVDSVSAVTYMSLQVNFDTAMDQGDASFTLKDNYVITGGLGGAVSSVEVGPDAYSAVVHFSETTDGDTYELQVRNVRSSLGLLPVDPSHDTKEFYGVGIGPAVWYAESFSRYSSTVYFTEDVEGADLEVPSAWDIMGDNGQLTIFSAVASPSSVYLEHSMSGVEDVLLVTAPSTVTDVALNPIVARSATYYAPRVVSVVGAAGLSDKSVQVEFSEAVTGVDDLSLYRMFEGLETGELTEVELFEVAAPSPELVELTTTEPMFPGKQYRVYVSPVPYAQADGVLLDDASNLADFEGFGDYVAIVGTGFTQQCEVVLRREGGDSALPTLWVSPEELRVYNDPAQQDPAEVVIRDPVFGESALEEGWPRA